MNELKVHKIGDLCFDFKMGKDIGIDFYLKSEADKVIEEKDKQIAKLKDKLRHYPMMVALLENDKKEIDEINSVHQKSLARLEELVNQEHPDKEEDHIEADDILCDMLNALGYKDLTEAWEKLDKWYC